MTAKYRTTVICNKHTAMQLIFTTASSLMQIKFLFCDRRVLLLTCFAIETGLDEECLRQPILEQFWREPRLFWR